MHAIIPVAGVGSRLRPHTYTLPKVLLTVAGKPILAHILDKLLEEGMTSATIIVGYMGEMVEEYVRSNYHFDCRFVQQPIREGLGHSIYLAKESLGDEPVLIILGDTIFDVDLLPVLAGEYSSLGVKHVEDARRFGVVEMQGEMVSRLIEKPEVPPTNLAIVGLYYIRHPRLLAECVIDLVENDRRNRGEYQLTDALQMMIDRGEKFTTFQVDGWFDCGKPETLLATNRHLLESDSLERPIPGVVINPPVYISPTADVANSIIGPHTTIAEGAVVRNSVITDSIVGENATVENAMLHESIIGNEAAIRGTFHRVNAGASSELDLG
ncbi:MAG: NTP transferase domain-containing protein [Bacteroidetes bacterium]|nr:NTP transferase domain-containing protein [Bacteroidota bacterium]